MSKPRKSEEQKREDEVLRRMLNTPPTPHKPKGKPSRSGLFDHIVQGMTEAVAIAGGEADPRTYRVHKPKKRLAKPKP